MKCVFVFHAGDVLLEATVAFLLMRVSGDSIGPIGIRFADGQGLIPARLPIYPIYT